MLWIRTRRIAHAIRGKCISHVSICKVDKTTHLLKALILLALAVINLLHAAYDQSFKEYKSALKMTG